MPLRLLWEVRHDARIWGLAVHQTLLAVTCGSDVLIYDISAGICVRTLDGVHSKTVRCVAFDPAGRHLAAASFDGRVSVWSTAAWRCIALLEGHENEVKGVAWYEDPSVGTLLATCGRDRTVWIWSAFCTSSAAGADDLEFECQAVIQEHQQDVKSIAWSPGLPTLASASYDETVRLTHPLHDNDFDDPEWVTKETITAEGSGTIWKVLWTAEDRLLAGTDSGQLLMFGADSKQVWRLQAHEGPIYGICQNGRFIVSAGQDRCLVISSDGVVRDKFFASSCDINSVVWCRQDVLAAGSDDGFLRLWQYNVE